LPRSTEGCASILYKDASKASTAAESLKITSSHLKDEGLIDSIISEPLGGIHAPPEPPSPITTEMIGVAKVDISNKFLAIAPDCPRSSAPIPG
jgi:acetyl-CoA carboxylase carboxyl transferase subunit alpha